MSTELVVDAFPRSGQTFAVAGLALGNPDLEIDHHHHGAGVFIRAWKRRLPSLAIIRDPLDACASFYVYKRQREGVARIVEDWIRFYASLMTYPSHVATFGEVTHTLPGVVATLAAASGLDLDPPPANRIIVAAVERSGGGRAGLATHRRPLPTPERREALDRARALVWSSPPYVEADSMYRTLVAYWTSTT